MYLRLGSKRTDKRPAANQEGEASESLRASCLISLISADDWDGSAMRHISLKQRPAVRCQVADGVAGGPFFLTTAAGLAMEERVKTCQLAREYGLGAEGRYGS